MRTNAAQTSIDCFHGQVQASKFDQHRMILSVMQQNNTYSMQELRRLTGLQTSTLSARLFEMRVAGSVEHAAKRRCSVSGVTIEPHKLAVKKLELV